MHGKAEFLFLKKFVPRKGGNWPKIGQKQSFFNFLKKFVINFFLDFMYNDNFLFAMPLHKSYICEKFGSWGMGQNALGLSECKIFKSTLTWE